MTNRTAQRVIVSGAAVVAVAAGWWQWREDGRIASADERIAAIDGVASVEYDPAHPYEVTLEPGLSRDRTGDVLAETSTILQSADDSQAYPMAFVLTDTGEFYVDLGWGADRTAAVIAATEVPGLAGADIDFDPDSLSQFTFENRDAIVPGARQILSSLDRAGIGDLRQLGGTLQFWCAGSIQSLPILEIETSQPLKTTLDRLARLERSLTRSGTTLQRADLEAGEQSTIAVRPRP